MVHSHRGRPQIELSPSTCSATAATVDRVRRRSPLPVELTGPFTAAEARALGVTDKVLRGPSMRRLTRGIYIAADVRLTHEVLARAACLAVARGVISHESALCIDRLPLALGQPEPRCAHLTVPAGVRLPGRPFVEAHRADLPPEHVRMSRAGPVTSPARTFVDMAARMELADLVALGDVILRRQLASQDELKAMVEWAHGRRGVSRAREALALLNPRSKSPMESRTRVVLVLGGCPVPEVNAPIYDDAGEWIAEGDLVWRAAKLVVEYDGRVHLTEAQRRADAQKHNQLVANGWTVIRLTADDVLKRPWQLVAMVQGQLPKASAA